MNYHYKVLAIGYLNYDAPLFINNLKERNKTMKQKHDYVIYEHDANSFFNIIATSNSHDNAVKIMNHYAEYEAWNRESKIAYKSFCHVELECGLRIQIQEVTRRSNPTSIKEFKESYPVD